MVLNTGIYGLVLRSYDIDDAVAYAKYADNLKIWKYFRDEFPYPYSEERAKIYIEETCMKNQNTHFAISLNGKLIGDIHIERQTDILRLSGFLGYWLAEEYWGKGIVTESVKVLTKYIFENTDMIRIFARVFSNNLGSIRVLENAGYDKEGYFKNAVIKEGRILNQLQYAKIKE